MKHYTLVFLLLFIAGIQTLSAQTVNKKLEPDPHVEKYLSSWFKMKPNAVFISPYDVIINKAFGLGYQRKINSKLWAEAGLQKGLKWIDLTNGSFNIVNYAQLANEDLYNEKGVASNSDSLKMKTNIHFSIYRNMLGAPVTTGIAYGLQLEIGTYDYRYFSMLGGGGYQQSSMTVISPLFAFLYKTSVYGPFGFDASLHWGPSFVKHAKDDSPVSAVSGLSYTSYINFNCQVKLFMAF